MKFTLKMDMDNAAFSDDPNTEAACILRGAAKAIERGERNGSLRDTNGNRVGSWEVTGGKHPGKWTEGR